MSALFGLLSLVFVVLAIVPCVRAALRSDTGSAARSSSWGAAALAALSLGLIEAEGGQLAGAIGPFALAGACGVAAIWAFRAGDRSCTELDAVVLASAASALVLATADEDLAVACGLILLVATILLAYGTRRRATTADRPFIVTTRSYMTGAFAAAAAVLSVRTHSLELMGVQVAVVVMAALVGHARTRVIRRASRGPRLTLLVPHAD